MYSYIYTCLKIIIHPRCCISNALHELTPKSASWQPTQKSYKNRFLFQKEHGQPYDFCREADNIGWTNHVYIIHVRAMIFCTYNQMMFIINNIKKVFN